MIAGGVLFVVGVGIFVSGDFGYRGLQPLEYVAIGLMIVGLVLLVSGCNLEVQQSTEELKEELNERTLKWERLEEEIKERVVENTGTFDVETISQNGEENYYNVRSGEELYRVYYKDFKIVGIEKNDKFMYAGDGKDKRRE